MIIKPLPFKNLKLRHLFQIRKLACCLEERNALMLINKGIGAFLLYAKNVGIIIL